MNNYNVKTYTRTAVPRSQRLREVGMNAAQSAMQQADQPELPSSLIKIIKDLDSWFGFDRDANAVYVKRDAAGEDVNFFTYGQLAGGGFRSSGGSGGGGITAISVNGTTFTPSPGSTVVTLDPYPTATSLGLKALAYKDTLAASDIPTLAISKISGLQSALDGKQATISDLADIRSGAALGATAVQTIYALTLQAGAFTAGTYTPNSAAKTINIPTTTSHISEGSNLYFTNARAISATDGTYLKLTGGSVSGAIRSGNIFINNGYVFSLNRDGATGDIYDATKHAFEIECYTDGVRLKEYFPNASYPLTLSSSNVGINTTSPSERLEVNGNIKTSGNIIIGNYILSVDSTAGALKLSKSDGTAAHFYSTGQMSAGGFSSSGGSGGGTVTAIKVNGTTYSPTTGTTVINLPDYPTATSLGLKALAYKASLTQSEVISYLGYTPLSTAGGTISGPITYSVASGAYAYFLLGNTSGYSMRVGTESYYTNRSAALSYWNGSTLLGAIGVSSTGVPFFHDSANHTLYHSGNSNNTSTAWTAKSFITGSQVSDPTGIYRGNTITTALTADDMVLWANGKKIGVWGDVEFKHSVVCDSALTASSLTLNGSISGATSVNTGDLNLSGDINCSTGLDITFNGGGAGKGIYLTTNVVRPQGASAGLIDFGASSQRWNTIYGTSLNLNGAITGATSITATGTVTTGNHYVSNGYLFDVNRNGSTGAIYDSTKHALEIECYADSIRFKEYYPSASFPLTLASGSVGVNATTIPSGVKLYVGGNFAATGNVGAGTYTSSSDRKFKDNISGITDEQAIAIIKALKPSSWDWNSLSHIEGRGHGFVAQEVAPYLPESVKEIDGHLTLNYTDLHAFEVKALQYHESEIERLRKRVSELERKLTNC